MANAKATEATKKVQEQNEEFLVKVKSTLEDSFNNFKKTVNFDNAPEFVKDTVGAQETLAKNWFETLIKVSKISSTEELNDYFMNQVKHFQKNITTAMDLEYWKGKEAKKENAEYLSADFAKETIIKAIDLCQPAK